MKTLLCASLVTLSVLASAGAHAQSGLYVGGSLGESRAKDDSGSLALSDRSATSGKLYGGYSFTPNLAIEVGRVRLGRFGGSTADATARGNFVDAVGAWPIGSGISALGRVGLFDGKVVQGGAADNGSSFKVGAGLQYDLNKTVALRGEWERYRFDSFGGSTTKADQYTLGVNWKF